MPSVILSNQRNFSVSEGQTLLDGALAAQCVLEYSCKTGRCGACKAPLLDGQTEIVLDEIGLSAEDKAQGHVLTCCRTAKTDVKLGVEDLPELANLKIATVPAKIDQIDHLASDVVCITLRTPPQNTLRFLPGQYVSVIGPGGLRRSYSLANAPRADGKLQLHIKRVEGGALSAYWFGQAKVNDLLRLEGPLGTFFLRSQLPAHLLLLATGTGIAPILSLLQQLEANPPSATQVALFWGNRHEQDIYLDLQQVAPNLAPHITLVLSKPADDWSGHRGHVQHAVMAQHTDFSNTAVYACGSNAMIQSARESLVNAGLPAHRFYSDAFVSSSQP